MALLFMEGFDNYTTGFDFAERLGCSTTSPTPSNYDIITGRIDGSAMRLQNWSYGITMGVPASTATHWVGFALRWPIAPANSHVILKAKDSLANTIWSLYTVPGGALTFRRNITTLGTTSQSIGTDWTYVEISTYVHDSAGTVNIKFNGAEVLNLTSQDTKPGTTDSIYSLQFTNMQDVTADTEIDDIIFGDDSGTDLTSHPGDCHIEYVLPDANGTTNNFTPITSAASNYEEVDEATTDDDTTYVYSSTATDKELYSTANLTGDVDTVYAVQPIYRSKKMSAGDRTVNATVRSNVTETDTTAHGLTTDYTWYADAIFENDPDGDVAWDEAAVNAMEIGFEIDS